MRNRLLLVVLIIGCVALVSSPALAEVINQTTGTQLFYDDFDSQPAANVSHVTFGTTMDAKPAAPTTGSWNISYSDKDCQVTDYVGAGGDPEPGAFQGDNYLRLFRTGSFLSAEQIFNGGAQTTDGHVIHFEQMLYLNPAALSGISVYGIDGNGGIRFLFAEHVDYMDEEVHYYASAGTYATTGVEYDRGVWQKWEIDYTIGADTVTLTVDGDSATIPTFGGSSGDLALIRFASTNTGGPSYIDEVPEPSSVALLVTGLIGLLAYAWRKRK